MNPFLSNPLTRNGTLPSVQFVGPDKAKNLQVPVAQNSYQEMIEAYRNMHVPQQEDPMLRFGPYSVRYGKDGTRILQMGSTPDNSWGDAWGRDDFAREQKENQISREYAKQCEVGNAKLSAELKQDEFRKQLLADIDSGKVFKLSKLKEEK